MATAPLLPGIMEKRPSPPLQRFAITNEVHTKASTFPKVFLCDFL